MEKNKKRENTTKIKKKSINDNTFNLLSDIGSEEMTYNENSLFQDNLPMLNKCDSDVEGSIYLISNPPPFAEDQIESQEKATLILSNDPIIKIEELLSLAE